MKKILIGLILGLSMISLAYAEEPLVVEEPPVILIEETKDEIPPVITLLSPSVTIYVGDVLDEGVSAFDDIDGDITPSIERGGTYIDSKTAGTFTITYDVMDKAGNHAIQVTKTILIEEKIVETIPTVTINLKVYSGDIILFDQAIEVEACPESPEIDAPVTLNGKCAIEQSALSNTWSWFDTNFKKDSDLPKTLGVLDELGGSRSDDENYIYWGWFSDLNYGAISLNKHIVSNGEELLLTYNSYPLRISTETNEATVGDEVVFKAEGKSTFNGDWTDMVWTSVKEVTVNLGTQSCVTNLEGICSIVLNTTGSLQAVGTKTLYVPSRSISIEVREKESGGGSQGGENIPVLFDIEKALAFLTGVEDPDGSFSGSDLYTDWAAIAVSSGDNSSLKSNLSRYLRNNNFDSDITTDNERHAMALMALGINPYDGTDINYIKKITDSFDGSQLGEKNLYNDDIFGLIVLNKAGYENSDEIIKKVVSFIISKQKSDGSWESVDITAAALQALDNYKSLSGVKNAISKAESYLINEQDTDGSFSNPFSTSWAIQALSLNSSYDTEVDKAILYLSKEQEEDGGMKDNSLENRIWATSYAIPAVLKMSWNDILESFSNEEIENSSSDETNDTTEDEAVLIIEKEKIVVEQTPVVLEVPQIVTKVIPEKIIVKKEIKPVFTETSVQTPLSASAINSISQADNQPVMDSISKVLGKIRELIIKIWHILGF